MTLLEEYREQLERMVELVNNVDLQSHLSNGRVIAYSLGSRDLATLYEAERFLRTHPVVPSTTCN